MRAIMVSLFIVIVVIICLPAFAVTQIDPGMDPVVVIPLDDEYIPGGGRQIATPLDEAEPEYQTREGLEKAARMVLSGELTVHVNGTSSIEKPKPKTTPRKSALTTARIVKRTGVSTSTVRRIARAMLGNAIGTHDANVDAHADAFAAHDNAPEAHKPAFDRHNVDPKAHEKAIGNAISNHDGDKESHQDIRGMVDSAFWRLFLLLLLVATIAIVALVLARRSARAIASASATATVRGGGPPPTPPAAPAGARSTTTTPGVLEVELDNESSSPSTPPPPPAAPAATTGRTLVIRPEEGPVQPLDVQLDTPPPPPPARRARRQRRQPQV